MRRAVCFLCQAHLRRTTFSSQCVNHHKAEFGNSCIVNVETGSTRNSAEASRQSTDGNISGKHCAVRQYQHHTGVFIQYTFTLPSYYADSVIICKVFCLQKAIEVILKVQRKFLPRSDQSNLCLLSMKVHLNPSHFASLVGDSAYLASSCF